VASHLPASSQQGSLFGMTSELARRCHVSCFCSIPNSEFRIPKSLGNYADFDSPCPIEYVWAVYQFEHVRFLYLDTVLFRGAIPEKEKFPMRKPCGIAHPGVCQERDSAIRPYINFVLGALHAVVMASPIGTWFRMTASVGKEEPYYETHFFLGSKRKMSPKVALFVLVDCFLGQLSLRTSARGLVFSCSSMLAKACVVEDKFQPGTPNPSITLTRMKCKNIPGILHSVTLDGEEESEELWKAKVRKTAKCTTPCEAPDGTILAGFDALAPKVKRARTGNGGGQGSGGGDPALAAHGPVGAPDLGVGPDTVPAAEVVSLQCDDELQECCREEDSDDSDFDPVAEADAVADSCSLAAEHATTKPTLQESMGTAAPPVTAKGGESKAGSSSSSATPSEPWWVTRTGRQATCSSCGKQIAAHEFRALYQPDRATVQDLRIWRNVWWRYYHLDRRCIPAEPPDFDVSRLCVDLKLLPQRMKETPEQYHKAQEDARAKFEVEFPHRHGVSARPV
jgi:hypothetical protein